jgi:photosynthetic reaction center cytochrome c subunit
MYFSVGSDGLEGEQAKGLAQPIVTLTDTPTAKVAVSGCHSAAGELAANPELARQRAFSVRDALRAAGVAADRVMRDKPPSAAANLAGEDPAARRVEVKVN